MRVRQLAERLRRDGLKVWFDEWVLQPGDRIPAMIDPPPRPSYGVTREVLAHSRVLACPAEAPERRRMLCPSAQAFGSDWAQLPTHHQPSTLNPHPRPTGHGRQCLAPAGRQPHAPVHPGCVPLPGWSPRRKCATTTRAIADPEGQRVSVTPSPVATASRSCRPQFPPD